MPDSLVPRTAKPSGAALIFWASPCERQFPFGQATCSASQSASDSGASAGPEITSPVGLKRDP